MDSVSIYEDESDEEYHGQIGSYQIDSDPDQTLHYRALNKTPLKKLYAHQNVEKPIIEQYEKSRIELYNTFYDSQFKDVTVIAETDNLMRKVTKTPVRLSNSFHHVWNFKFETFEQPRSLIGVQHERLWGNKKVQN